jgi:hypothetical protein
MFSSNPLTAMVATHYSYVAKLGVGSPLCWMGLAHFSDSSHRYHATFPNGQHNNLPCHSKCVNTFPGIASYKIQKSYRTTDRIISIHKQLHLGMDSNFNSFCTEIQVGIHNSHLFALSRVLVERARFELAHLSV